MKKRIGVFVCSCGTDISSAVEIDAVTAASRRMEGVVFAGHYIHLCSKPGQQIIIDTIKRERLGRMVVASCSPRLHEGTFMKTALSAGMNPYLVEIANIREHCSRVHKEKKEATVKAIALIRAAAAKAARNQELIPIEIPVVPRALVIGGGIAGIQSALDIAEAGYEVDLLERSSSIGGRMALLETTFSDMARILTSKMLELSSHPGITLYTYAEIEKLTGYVGSFDVTLRLKVRSGLMEECTGCGLCPEKCSVNADSEFDEGLCSHKSINIPFPLAVPNVPVIDRASCLWFRQADCAVCKKACPQGAVDFNQTDNFVEKKYGAIIAAAGFDILKPDTLSRFGCRNDPNTGIFLAGACQGPMDIAEAVTQASAAASKVIDLLSYDILVSDPRVSQVNSSLCSGCLSCLHVCPYGAISEKIIEENAPGNVFRSPVAEVNGILCRGCGSCNASCRAGAISLKGWTDDQLIAEVDAICL